MDIATSGQDFSGGFLPFIDIITDDGITDVEQNCQVELSVNKVALVISLMTPADEAIDPELPGGEPVAKGFDILCSEDKSE